MSEAAKPNGPAQPASALVDHLFRNRAGQMVASLTRLLGPAHLETAEEIVQESLLKALQVWPYSGIPENPAGWLFRVARNAALDRLRHGALADKKNRELAAELPPPSVPDLVDEIQLEERLRDDELSMMLMCCHPALAPDVRVTLSLRTVGGFSTREIARAFLSDEATIAQRLVRAKRKIRESGIRFELPSGKDLADRLDSAMEVIYLMFNEGYAAQSGEDMIRHELCNEALRLGALLAESSVRTPTVHALVALMAFQAARLPARLDSAGELVLLDEQDRALWDHDLIGFAFHHFELCAAGDCISSYHAQAAIAATHARALHANATDWNVILQLYDQLMDLDPSPVVALNRAVAVAKLKGAREGMSALEPLAEDHALRNYYLLPAVQGRLLLELGDKTAAARCFRLALERPCSVPEKKFLRRKLAQCQMD